MSGVILVPRLAVYRIVETNDAGDEGKLLHIGARRETARFLSSYGFDTPRANHAMKCAEAGPYFILSERLPNGELWTANLYAENVPNVLC